MVAVFISVGIFFVIVGLFFALLINARRSKRRLDHDTSGADTMNYHDDSTGSDGGGD